MKLNRLSIYREYYNTCILLLTLLYRLYYHPVEYKIESGDYKSHKINNYHEIKNKTLGWSIVQ